MSNQTSKLTRRNFIKGAAYTTALSIGGMSSLAVAKCSTLDKNKARTVTLFNQSDKTVVLNSSQPISLKKVNGWVVVNINKASEENILNLKTDEIMTISSGHKHTFEVDSELATLIMETGDYVVMTNEFNVLNNTVPITTYDVSVA